MDNVVTLTFSSSCRNAHTIKAANMMKYIATITLLSASYFQ